MPKPRNTVPKYSHHKPSGQGYSRLPGTSKNVYFGVYGTPASKDAYAAWLARIPQGGNPAPAPVPAVRGDGTVGTLALRFLDTQLAGYSPSETKHYQAAVGVLVAAAGDVGVSDFGPLALTRVRDTMIAAGWTREHINAQVRRVRAVFRWGESVETVPAGKWFQLRTMIGLKSGKSAASNQRKKLPVPDEVVDATLPHLSPTVAGMIRFQRLTGCRPQDVCRLNADEIDRTGDVWVFAPAKHKGAHRGQVRTVYIGPKAKEVIRALIESDPDAAAVFSPRTAWAEGRQAGAKGKRPNYTPKGPPANVGAVFDTNAYIKAIARGVDRANSDRGEDDQLPHWTPNQLRHAAGTSIRDGHGLETAQKILGHKHASTTERYASPTDRAAVEYARKNG